MFALAEVLAHVLALTRTQAEARAGGKRLRVVIDENTTFGTLGLGEASIFAALCTVLEDRWGPISLPPNINPADLTIGQLVTSVCAGSSKPTEDNPLPEFPRQLRTVPHVHRWDPRNKKR